MLEAKKEQVLIPKDRVGYPIYEFDLPYMNFIDRRDNPERGTIWIEKSSVKSYAAQKVNLDSVNIFESKLKGSFLMMGSSVDDIFFGRTEVDEGITFSESRARKLYIGGCNAPTLKIDRFNAEYIEIGTGPFPEIILTNAKISRLDIAMNSVTPLLDISNSVIDRLTICDSKLECVKGFESSKIQEIHAVGASIYEPFLQFLKTKVKEQYFN